MTTNNLDSTPYSQLIAYLAKGTIDGDASEQLSDLVKQVRLTGKKGSITLKLEVSMFDAASESTMRIVPEISLKLPKVNLPSTVLFSTYNGDLLRDDPEQMPLAFRTVESSSITKEAPPSGPAKEVAETVPSIKTVNTDTGVIKNV